MDAKSELKGMLTVCNKVTFPNAEKAKSIKAYMEKLGYSNVLSKRFMGRMQELSNVNSSSGSVYKCVCCNSKDADVNMIFCGNCFSLLKNQYKRMLQSPTTKSLSPSGASTVGEKSADDNKNIETKNSQIVNDITSPVTNNNTEKNSDITGSGNVAYDSSTKDINNPHCAEIDDGWDPEKSTVLGLTMAILPVLSDPKVNIREYDVNTKNDEIDSFDEVPVASATIKQNAKKKHTLRNVILLTIVGFVYLLFLASVDMGLHPEEYNDDSSTDRETKCYEGVADAQTDERAPNNYYEQGSAQLYDQNSEIDDAKSNEQLKLQDDYGVHGESIGDGEVPDSYDFSSEEMIIDDNYASVDFSRYYVTEEQLLNAYTERANSILHRNDGTPLRISLENREYNEETDWIIFDIYDEERDVSYGQMCLRKDEKDCIKGVWLMTKDYTLPRILYEIIQPDLSETEMTDFMTQTIRDDGRFYYYLDGGMYYCISYISNDDIYLTVVTRDEDYVQTHTGEVGL